MDPDQPTVLRRRRRGEHGRSPLSLATRRHLLAEMLRRAEGGDAEAAAQLIRLSLEVRRGGAKSGAGEG